MRKLIPIAVIVLALAANGVTAQEAPAVTARKSEGMALVGIFEPTPVRLGVLIPLSAKWVIRPELGGDAYNIEGQSTGTTILMAVSVLRRSAPTEAGYVYGMARMARYVDEYGNGPRLTGYQAHLGAGGHAHLKPVLAIFAEAGIQAVYAEEDDASTTIDRSIRVFTRFGFAVRRPRPRD
jgi:hypothetical protein